MDETECRYLRRRMEREMEMARRSEGTPAAMVHVELARLYAERLGTDRMVEVPVMAPPPSTRLSA